MNYFIFAVLSFGLLLFWFDILWDIRASKRNRLAEIEDRLERLEPMFLFWEQMNRTFDISFDEKHSAMILSGRQGATKDVLISGDITSGGDCGNITLADCEADEPSFPVLDLTLEGQILAAGPSAYAQYVGRQKKGDK